MQPYNLFIFFFKMKNPNAFWVSIFFMFLISFPALADIPGFQECMFRILRNQVTADYIFTSSSSLFLPVLRSNIQNARFNTSDTPKPLIIVTPRTESEVQAVIRCAKDQDLQVRVRGGGHDFEGLSHTSFFGNQFLILDLVNFKNITVDPAKKTAWVGGGSTLGELYYRISEKSRNLGFPAGLCPSVGVGGHISGGGHGMMSRKFGLAADNVIDACLVDGRGRILDRKSMGKDLFWAIRGGGGNTFGVILGWKLRLVDVPENVTVFTIRRSLEQSATKLVHKWQTVAPMLPKELFMRVMAYGEQNTIIAEFKSLFLGPTHELLLILNEMFPELGVTRQDLAELSWARSVLYLEGFPLGTPIQALLNRIANNGKPYYFKSKSDFVKDAIPINAFEGVWNFLHENNSGFIMLSPYGGRMSEISESSIPFPHRAGNLYNIQYWTNWSEEGDDASQIQMSWIRRLYGYFTPFVFKSPRKASLNYRDLDIGPHNSLDSSSYKDAKFWGTKYFNKNFDKLVRVKSKVDPHNFFRNEQSIPPKKILS
ncbi:unnamed protein product [Cuscuta epithymum]|uniref:FAD-binding PCMH-type domain-containing protein n=1 Tax=Cuscuta epithymum TaxID=186058 RepID=A0AAV0CGW3_9ASTE|nr:unnamed protein product [Cuscuta epithymum]